jgi:heavy metal sensor kinase
MPLTTRLLLFFLAALACVLGGFSLSLFALARQYLDREADAGSRAALDTLSAAVEFEPDGLEWEATGRRLSLPAPAGEPVRWASLTGEGRRLDGSRDGLDGLAAPATWPAPERDVVEDRELGGTPWRVSWRRMQAPPTARPSGRPVKPGAAEKFDALVLVVAFPLGPMKSTLRNLALALAGLSVGLWACAAVAGRWLCRRALLPLRQMEGAAHAIHADALGQRLPVPATGDELEGLGKSFNDLLARLEESFARQRRFTGDASHQLRTPLTSLLGQVELALRRDRPVEEYRRVLGSVHAQANNLHQIVEILLFLARADAEALLPDLEEVDLVAWAIEYLRAWEGHPRASDIHLRQPEGPCPARAHPALLGQLVGNLLDNACKYSDPGTPITLRIEEEADGVRLEVANEGRGIPAEDLPHVFEPFYRSPRSRRDGLRGVGLGLAVARRIALALGGSLVAQSTEGKGARFLLLLRKGPRAG